MNCVCERVKVVMPNDKNFFYSFPTPNVSDGTVWRTNDVKSCFTGTK